MDEVGARMGRGLVYLWKDKEEVLNIQDASGEAARLTERQFPSQHCH